MEKMEEKISAVSTELTRLKELLVISFQKVDNNFEIVKVDFTSIQKKRETLTKEVEILRGATSEGFDDVGSKIESLTSEITKIGQTTGYDELFTNRKSIS
ncbi:MAG: hypothetical protein J0M30_04830 [Chitinophagales bacterium]|nr:hypothetical protein [Chitinophagales bacterium]